MSPPPGRPKEDSLPLGGKARSAKGAPMSPPPVPPSAGVRWRSAGMASPQGLAMSGLTPKEGSLPPGGTARSAKGAS